MKTMGKRHLQPVFTATLFTIAKPWKQLTRPLMEEWIKTVWGIYTNIHNGIFLGHKKKEILPCVTRWIDFMGTAFNTVPSHLYVESKKKERKIEKPNS